MNIYEEALEAKKIEAQKEFIDFISKYNELKYEDFVKIAEESEEFSYIIQKIELRAQEWNETAEAVWDELKTSKVLAKVFVKDPKKQNFYENFIFENLEDYIPCIKDKKQLRGKEKEYMEQGSIVSTKSKTNTSKSMDFKVHIEYQDVEITLYIMHKYTMEQGGAQDNQYLDIQNWCKQLCDSSKLSNTYFIALLDGEYYDKIQAKDGMNRRDILNKVYGASNFRAVSNKELYNLVCGWVAEQLDYTQRKEFEEEVQQTKSYI